MNSTTTNKILMNIPITINTPYPGIYHISSTISIFYLFLSRRLTGFHLATPSSTNIFSLGLELQVLPSPSRKEETPSNSGSVGRQQQEYSPLGRSGTSPSLPGGRVRVGHYPCSGEVAFWTYQRWAWRNAFSCCTPRLKRGIASTPEEYRLASQYQY